MDMNKRDYERFITEAKDRTPILAIGGTKIYEYRNTLVIVAKYPPHPFIVTDNDKRIIGLLETLKERDYSLGFKRNNKEFIIIDKGKKGYISRLSRMIYHTMNGESFDDCIINTAKECMTWKQKSHSWDCRIDNLVVTKNQVKKRRTKLLKRDIKLVGGLIAPDEEFRPFKGESGILISNYGRVLSIRNRNPVLIKQHFNKGYMKVEFQQSMYGKRKRTMYYVHRMVAETFVPVPEWIKEGERLDVHHIRKVDKKTPLDGINKADNLTWIPRKFHKLIDATDALYIRINSHWQECDFLEASAHYDMNPYDFLTAINTNRHNSPTKTYGRYRYFNKTVLHDGIETVIDVRLRVR